MNRPTNASSSSGILARIRVRASCGQHRRVAFPGDQRGQHLPPGHPEDVRRPPTDSLIWASSSSFSTRFFSAVRTTTRSTRYRVRSRSSRIGARRHETRAQHLPLGDLAQPHRVQPVGLRPAGQMLDVAGVDQPRSRTRRLQQVEHRLPVVRRWPPSPPGSRPARQPVASPHNDAGHRRVRCASPAPGARPFRAGHPDTAHHLGLADIQRRDPLDDLLVVLDRAASPASAPARPPCQARRSPAGAARDRAKLIRVLEATLKGPQRSSQRPTSHDLERIRVTRRQRAASTGFSARNGPPARANQDSVSHSPAAPRLLGASVSTVCRDGCWSRLVLQWTIIHPADGSTFLIFAAAVVKDEGPRLTRGRPRRRGPLPA